MAMSPAEVQRARKKRISIIVGITLAVEVGLAVLGHFGPALRNLIWPVYWIVLIVAVATIWHAFRRHTTRDRRYADRRRG